MRSRSLLAVVAPKSIVSTKLGSQSVTKDLFGKAYSGLLCHPKINFSLILRGMTRNCVHFRHSDLLFVLTEQGQTVRRIALGYTAGSTH